MIECEICKKSAWGIYETNKGEAVTCIRCSPQMEVVYKFTPVNNHTVDLFRNEIDLLLKELSHKIDIHIANGKKNLEANLSDIIKHMQPKHINFCSVTSDWLCGTMIFPSEPWDRE